MKIFLKAIFMLTVFACCGCVCNSGISQKLFDKGVAELEAKWDKWWDGLSPTEKEVIINEDEIEWDKLKWKYGGFNGAAALRDPDITIGNLKAVQNRIDYTWVKNDLDIWGAKNADDCIAVCAAFVKNEDGDWVGGKFDWISSSRTSRDLDHLDNYNGWNLDDVPRNTEIAFVILYSLGGKRTNVIKAEWRR